MDGRPIRPGLIRDRAPVGADDHMTAVYHLNVNCSDLTASSAFYVDRLGFTPVIHTAPTEPQPGHAFGLDRAQWEAWLLEGGQPGPLVDLLQWQLPPPVPAALTGMGWRSLELTHPSINEATADPDGVPIMIARGPATALVGARVRSVDPDRAVAFHCEVMGMRRADDPGCVVDDNGFTIAFDRVDEVSGATPPAPANRIGIFRMAMLTDDLDGRYRRLVERGVPCLSPPATLRMGPGLPPLRALLFRGPDGNGLELIEPPG